MKWNNHHPTVAWVAGGLRVRNRTNNPQVTSNRRAAPLLRPLPPGHRCSNRPRAAGVAHHHLRQPQTCTEVEPPRLRPETCTEEPIRAVAISTCRIVPVTCRAISMLPNEVVISTIIPAVFNRRVPVVSRITRGVSKIIRVAFKIPRKAITMVVVAEDSSRLAQINIRLTGAGLLSRHPHLVAHFRNTAWQHCARCLFLNFVTFFARTMCSMTWPMPQRKKTWCKFWPRAARLESYPNLQVLTRTRTHNTLAAVKVLMRTPIFKSIHPTRCRSFVP
mmetsp:Transcript_19090/g.52346  ORF Transcript_19090/g.52346 Transcript_19090/m.52346 type:complete len:276 (+) Transcript_19090:2295-3122(+)